MFRDQASEPARVIVHHRNAGGDIIEELIRGCAAVEGGDILQDHQAAIERGGDGAELRLGDGREEETVREAEFGGAGRKAFLLLAVADEGELHAGVATTLELYGDVQQCVESVGDAMGASEAGDKVIGPDAGQGQARALGRIEDLEVAAVRNHGDRLTFVGPRTDAFDDPRRKADAGVGRTVTEEL